MSTRTRAWIQTASLALTLATACGSDGTSGSNADLTEGPDSGASGGSSSGGTTAAGGTNTGGAATGGAAGSGGASGGTGGTSDGGTGNGGDGAGGTSGTGGGGAGGTSGSGGASSGGTGGVPDVGPVIEPGDPGASDVVFEIRADEGLRPISPLIYGTNGTPEIEQTRQTLARSGGNRLTAYNWENNASNAGSDWLFQNDGYLSSSDEAGRVARDVIEAAASNGAAAIVTIPIVDYVAADKNGGGDVRNSGSNYLETRFRQNLPTKGAAFSYPPDTSDGFVYQDEFISWLKTVDPSAQVLLSLDNEPDLWAHTHAEVHPDKVTYAELWQRNHDFAKAAKAVWPEAKILGFVSYGFNGYVTLQDAPDANGRDFIEWYLDQAEAAEQAEGSRLIDYLDLHWYPEARGGGERITEGGTGDAVVQARVQAPRSLWDDGYDESSWIRDYLGEPVDLLSRLQTKIDAHYPGTQLAFTEWNFGGGDHISGAVAVADVLGIFGREGVGLAAYWGLKADESFAWAAFRAFRNYDGSGAAFGDTAISATSSDVPNATVYASIDAANPARTVVIASNRSSTARTAGERIAHSTSYATAATWTLSGGNADLVSGPSLTAVAANAFSVPMAPLSVTVLVPAP